MYSIGQEARGAHFISHDLAAAAIVWFTQLLLYVLILAPQDVMESRESEAACVATTPDRSAPAVPEQGSR